MRRVLSIDSSCLSYRDKREVNVRTCTYIAVKREGGGSHEKRDVWWKYKAAVMALPKETGKNKH